MDTAQWPQPTKEMERRKRSEEALNKYCPRCNSKHTKFCYYNNYSLTQPRYLCKTCRRYWTHGGSLRTIPVGGASRKNKTTTRTCSKNKPFLPPPLALEKGDQVLVSSQGSSSKSSSSSTAMAFPNASSSLSGLGLRYELIKPAFDFSLGDPLNQEEVFVAPTNTSERLLLPFEILKPPSSTPSSNSGVEYNHGKRNSDHLTHDKEEEADRSAAFWTDVFGGESWQL